MHKSELLKRLGESHRGLMDSFSGLYEETLISELIDGNWTVLDLLIHVSHWHTWSLGFVDALLADGSVVYVPPGNDFDAINAEVVARRRGQVNMIDLVDELTTQYRRMHQAITRMSQVQLEHQLPVSDSEKTYAVFQLFLAEIEHDEEHGQQIRQWREQKAVGSRQSAEGS